ncbi:MAG: ATP-dependent DNA ligase, partial [Bacteroidetes bacterium]
MTTLKADGHQIELSNPGKVLFPAEGINKKDMVEYYRKISAWMLPWLENRPVMLHRYPDGIEGKNFYQKQEPEYFPGWIDTIRVKVKKRGQDIQEYVNCNSEATLLYIANQGTITPHVWLSRKESIEHPDKMIYDLDPPDGDFSIVRECAGDFRRLFEELELNVFAMTTGSKGAHLVVPLDGKTGFGESRRFARDLAGILAGRHPDRYTTETLKKKQ